MYGPAADVKEKSPVERFGSDAVMYPYMDIRIWTPPDLQAENWWWAIASHGRICDLCRGSDPLVLMFCAPWVLNGLTASGCLEYSQVGPGTVSPTCSSARFRACSGTA